MSNDWGQTEPPAFTVQRVTTDGSGGDFVRGRPTTRQNSLRYKVRSVQTSTADPKISIKSTMTAVTTGYGSIDLSWGWPEDYSDWTEVAIVRSGFGHPSTVNDGVTVFRSTKDSYEFFDGLTALTITIPDESLQAGRWYYYTLFFFRTEWEPVMFTEALTPKDFGHFAHLWNGVPEYYRWVDGRFRGQEGHLQQFLKMFGFELDLTREYVESWQETYNIDNSPQPLLFQVGLNLGVSTDQGLGEIRTRGLISQINQLYEKRGTAEGLKLVVEASSKYETTITSGRNMLLLPDDSEFLTGSGNWATPSIGISLSTKSERLVARGFAYDATCTPAGFLPMHADALADALDASVLSVSTSVNLVAPLNTADKATNSGYGVMSVLVESAWGAGDLTLACGLGTTPDGTVLTPKFHGVPVEQNVIYGFSCQFKAARTTSTATVGIYWFDRNEKYLGTSITSTGVTGNWQALLVQGLSPYVTNSAVQSSFGVGLGTGFDAMTTSSIAGDWPQGTMRGFGNAQARAVDAAIFTVEPMLPYLSSNSQLVSSVYAGATYAVPYITVSGRVADDDFKLMGCMFYDAGPGGTVTSLSPDYYLTLGTNELIGVASGKIMGG